MCSILLRESVMQSQIFIVCCNVQEYSRLFNVFTVPLLLSFFSWITVNIQKIYKTKKKYIYILPLKSFMLNCTVCNCVSIHHLKVVDAPWVWVGRSQSGLHIWTLQLHSIPFHSIPKLLKLCQAAGIGHEQPFSRPATYSLLDLGLGLCWAAPEHSPCCVQTISVELSLCASGHCLAWK